MQHKNNWNPLFLPLRDYKPIQVSREPVLIQEDYLLVKEVSPGQIYDFNLGEERFRKILAGQKQVPTQLDPKILDLYFLYHYVVCYLQDGKSYTYAEEIQSEDYLPGKVAKFRRKVKRQYFPDDSHDLDSYHQYHQIVRVIQFPVKNRVFEIIIPRTEGEKLFEPTGNFWIKIRSDHQFDFPEGTTFVIKEISDVAE